MFQFKPEPVEKLKERYKASIVTSYNVIQTVITGNRPGIKQENNFDFQDGIRLIISRDHMAGREVIHFSASIDPQYFKPKSQPTLAGLLKLMVAHFCDISGYKPKDVHFIQITEGKGIPHWYVPFTILN